MRAGFHESQTQKETVDAEAKRYKVKYLMSCQEQLFYLSLSVVELIIICYH